MRPLGRRHAPPVGQAREPRPQVAQERALGAEPFEGLALDAALAVQQDDQRYLPLTVLPERLPFRVAEYRESQPAPPQPLAQLLVRDVVLRATSLRVRADEIEDDAPRGELEFEQADGLSLLPRDA